MSIAKLKEEYGGNFEGLFQEDKALIASIILMYVGLGQEKSKHFTTLLAVSESIECYIYELSEEANEFLMKVNQGFSDPELLNVCRALLEDS